MSDHDLSLPWRTDDPYSDVIKDSYGEEVASVCSNDDCAFIVKAVNAHDALVEHLDHLAKVCCDEDALRLLDSLRVDVSGPSGSGK